MISSSKAHIGILGTHLLEKYDALCLLESSCRNALIIGTGICPFAIWTALGVTSVYYYRRHSLFISVADDLRSASIPNYLVMNS